MLVSTELLIQVLQLPAGTQIVDAGIDSDGLRVQLLVTHPDIPIDVKRVDPVITREGNLRLTAWNPS